MSQPSTPLSRIDTGRLYTPFLSALRSLLDDCAKEGRDFFVVSGFRTYAAQDELWAQGRHAPGRIVTNAKGGESAHCFGIAADLCLDGDMDRAGLQPDYKHEHYEILKEATQRHGLLWGGAWNDGPHVQIPNYITASQMAPLRNAYEAGGLVDVFLFLENKGAPHV